MVVDETRVSGNYRRYPATVIEDAASLDCPEPYRRLVRIAVDGALVHPVGDKQPGLPELAVFTRSGLGVNYFSKSHNKIATFLWFYSDFIGRAYEGVLGHVLACRGLAEAVRGLSL